MPVQLLFVGGAGGAVHGYQKGLEAHWLDVLPEVAGHIFGHLGHPIRGLEHLFEFNGPVQYGVHLIDVADALGGGQVQEFPFQCLPVHQKLGGSKSIVEADGGSVIDGLGYGVFIQVALGVVGSEDLEGSLALGKAVDGCPGEADVGGVGQSSQKVVAQVSTRSSMRLVDQDDHIIAGAHVGGDVVELMDHGDHQAPEV